MRALLPAWFCFEVFVACAYAQGVRERDAGFAPLQVSRVAPPEVDPGRLAFYQQRIDWFLKQPRPRLVFSRDDIDSAKKAVARGERRDALERLQSEVDAFLASTPRIPREHILGMALLWQVTGESHYLQAAVQALRKYEAQWSLGDKGPTFEPIVAYDLIFDDLTPQQRRELHGRLLPAFDREQYFQRSRGPGSALAVFATLGNGVDDEAQRKHAVEFLAWGEQQVIPSWEIYAARRGGTFAAPGGCQCPRTTQAPLGVLLSRLLDRDLFRPPYHFFYHQATFCTYLLPPWYQTEPPRRMTILPLKPDYPNQHQGAVSRVSWAEMSQRTGNGLYGWWERWLAEGLQSGRYHWQSKSRIPLLCFELLGWRVPDDCVVAPEMLPETAWFESLGWTVSRSDWNGTADSLCVLFSCGPHVITGPAGHSNYPRHNNAFAIYGGGQVILSMHEYCEPEITGQRLPPRERLLATNYRAGERLTAMSRFQQGQTLALESTPDYTYVAGVAGDEYEPRVEYTRQFIHLRPNIFVIFDRVGKASGWELPARPGVHGTTIPLPEGATGRMMLHVFEVGPKPRAKIEDGSDGDRIGARIRVDDRTFVFRFATTGPVAAEVVVDSEKPRTLARGIDDHYGLWQKDKRFGLWKSDARFEHLVPLTRTATPDRD